MDPASIIILVVTLTLGIRIVAGALDGDRIRDYLTERGCKLLSKQWTPFGHGWFGQSTSRLYSVEYEDGGGNRRRATVKTSLWSGVYFTEDTMIEPASSGVSEPTEMERLRAENERLRAELEQRSLKR